MRHTPALMALALALAASPAALAHGGADRPAPERPPAAADAPAPERAGDDHPAPRHEKGEKGERGERGERGEKGHGKGRGGKHRTQHLAQACVVAAAEGGIEVRVLSVNAHLRRALDGDRTFTVKVGDGTVIRLVGRARHLESGARAPRSGSLADLAAGDRVTVHIRAPRGTAAADLPAAKRIIDHGPGRRCAAGEAPPPPSTDPAPAPEPQPDPQPAPSPDPAL